MIRNFQIQHIINLLEILVLNQLIDQVISKLNDYPVNLKNILLELGITMDGVYREKILDAGVYQYMEKYMRTTGGSKDGIYCYNFCLDSNRRVYQPSGAMNVNKFKKVFLNLILLKFH